MKNKKYFIILLIIFVLLLFFTNKSYSKYVFNRSDTRTIESDEFYFESSMEDNNNTFNINWDSDSPQVINFNVDNYLNKLLITPHDIKYTVSYEVTAGNANDLVFSLKDNDDNLINFGDDILLTGGYLNSNYHSFIISSHDKLDIDNRYTVKLKIKSVEPFVKEIETTLNIRIYEIADYIYEFVDNPDYVDLKIQVYNKFTENLLIEFNNVNLMVDVSNDLIDRIDLTEDEDISVVSLNKNKLLESKSFTLTFIKRRHDFDVDDSITIK